MNRIQTCGGRVILDCPSADTLNPCPDAAGDPGELLALARARMPFGKHQGLLLIDLPESYVVWMAKNGWPDGKLGRMLQTIYEIKLNGLEYLFAPLREHGHSR